VTDGIVAFTTRTECGSPVRGHAKSFHVSGTVADAADGKGVTLRRAACRTFPRTNRVHPFLFRPQAPRALAACGANYKRWDNVTRDPLARMFWSLCPELRDFVPFAGVIDRLGCGQQDSLPPSVRPSDGQRPFFAHLAGAEEQMRSIPSTNVPAAKLCRPKAAADFRPRWTRETNSGNNDGDFCARPFGSAGRYGLTFGSD
jgi:hypothetical protein